MRYLFIDLLNRRGYGPFESGDAAEHAASDFYGTAITGASIRDDFAVVPLVASGVRRVTGDDGATSLVFTVDDADGLTFAAPLPPAFDDEGCAGCVSASLEQPCRAHSCTAWCRRHYCRAGLTDRLRFSVGGLVEAALRSLPLLVKLGDFIGNGPVDANNPQSLGERCDVIGALRDALSGLGVPESTMAPTRTEPPHAPGTVRHLTCCCCGASAGRWAQHYNRDTGFGLCAACAAHLRGQMTSDIMERLYGKPGINYADPDVTPSTEVL